jgi:Mn2+/Fe2+ NRAMP family transporter
VWSAIVNGIIAVPIMAAMMLVVARHAQMGRFVAGKRLMWLGWTATAVMALAVVAMFVFQ